jgi:hypothetical protein
LLCEFIGGCGFDFLPSDALMKFLAQFLCGGGGFDDIICENVIFLLCGYDYAQLNKVCVINLVPRACDPREGT